MQILHTLLAHGRRRNCGYGARKASGIPPLGTNHFLDRVFQISHWQPATGRSKVLRLQAKISMRRSTMGLGINSHSVEKMTGQRN